MYVQDLDTFTVHYTRSVNNLPAFSPELAPILTIDKSLTLDGSWEYQLPSVVDLDGDEVTIDVDVSTSEALGMSYDKSSKVLSVADVMAIDDEAAFG